MAYLNIDLEEFDTDELIAELELRGLQVYDKNDGNDALNRIFNAMHQGKQEEAWELMRSYVCDKTGRVI